MIYEVMQEVLNYLNQEGLSIWTKNEQSVNCILKWKSPLYIEEFVKNCLEGSEDIVSLDKTIHFFRLDDLGIVFSGDKEVELSTIQTYLNEHHMLFSLLIQLYKKEKKEQDLKFLMKIAHTVASSMQSDEILDVIIERAIQAIPQANTGFLFLHDSQIKKILVRSAIGFRKESYKKTRLSPGEGISGMAFERKEALIFNGEAQVNQAMKNMTKQNFKYYIDATIYKEFPSCAMSAPLMYQGEAIGVLTIDSFIEGAFFTEEDLEILQALADHVAVMIVHAKILQKEKKQRKELQLVHQALIEEHEQLQRTIDFHNRLTNIVAQGKGMTHIIQTLHNTVKVPVAVYDSLLRNLSSSQDAENKFLPNGFFKHPAMKRVVETKKWQKIQLDSQEELIILPIIGTDYILGYLCSWVRNNEFIEQNSVVFEYSATVLSLEWTKQEAIKEAQNRIKGDFLEEILTGRVNATLENQAGNLNLDLSDYYSVLLCKRQNNLESNRTYKFIDINIQNMYKQLENVLEKANIYHVIIQRGDHLFVILTFSKKQSKNVGHLKLKSLIRLLNNLQKDYQIGIGRIYKGLLRLNKSYNDALECIDLINKSTFENIVYYAELGFYRFLLQQEKAELEFFLSDILGDLIAYDKKKKGEYLKTLLSYVKNNREINRITECLSIHYNTLYYRVRRIQEILNVSLDNPEDWFNIQLACRIYEYLDYHTL